MSNKLGPSRLPPTIGFMPYYQYPLPYHHWENNQPPPTPPCGWDPPAHRSLHGFPPHNQSHNLPLHSVPYGIASHVQRSRQQLRRTNSSWDLPQLHTTHSAYDQPLSRHSSPNSCWYPPPHHSAYDHPLAQHPPPPRPLPCCEPDQIITSEIMGFVEEKIEAGEYDHESEKKEDFRAEGKLVDEEFCYEIKLTPDSHSLSLGQEPVPHQTMAKSDFLNGMGSFLDEIGDSQSTLLDDNHENKATFDVDEFIEPQSVKLRDDLDLCVGDVTGIVYRSTSLDADARFIPPRIALPCLSVLGYTGELFVLAWNFANYIGSPLMIFVGGDEGGLSAVRCTFDPGGGASPTHLLSTLLITSWIPP